MPDKYSNFADLAKSNVEGADFTINFVDRESDVLVFGPHAGAIEPGTSEIVKAIAGNNLSYYLFEGTKADGNGELHITSTNFDEPQALNMVEKSQTVLAIHGEKSENKIVYLGGRNQHLQSHIQTTLNDAGYLTEFHENPGLQGTSFANICNRCASSSGVQLELSKGLRKTLFYSLTSLGRKSNTPELIEFAEAVRQGLDRANAL